MKKEKLVIGILGGMGPYATVDFYRRLVDAFPAEKDWQKPRILIDSYSTIPSRVRAVLYHEKEEELLNRMTESVRNLIRSGANRIVISCNTAHVFLPEIIRRIPESREIIINIIQASALECKKKGYTAVKLLASEGTVQTGIYTEIFKEQNIRVINPDKEQLIMIRELIEDVKQNHITTESLSKFQQITNDGCSPVVAGCSELPVLYGKCVRRSILLSNEINDPLQSAIDCLLKTAFMEGR